MEYMRWRLCLFVCLLCSGSYGDDFHAKLELEERYIHHCREYSDIYEHLPLLKQLASQCSSAVEIGVRTMVSSWAILEGLASSSSDVRGYLGIDIESPPSDTLRVARRLAEANGIGFQFWQANDMAVDIEPTDFLFIDSLHTYCHLTYELEKFSPKVGRFIALHDTNDPLDDVVYRGDNSEYPLWIDRHKRGLWLAVEDFLKRHPEWELYERRFNNYGLTILRRY